MILIINKEKNIFKQISFKKLKHKIKINIPFNLKIYNYSNKLLFLIKKYFVQSLIINLLKLQLDEKMVKLKFIKLLIFINLHLIIFLIHNQLIF